MKSKTLTQNDIEWKEIKSKQERFKPIINTHRIVILKAVSNKVQSFKNLKLLCVTTDGNLASHMNALEKEELIKVIKEFDGKYPKTSYQITKKGINLYNEISKFLKEMTE